MKKVKKYTHVTDNITVKNRGKVVLVGKAFTAFGSVVGAVGIFLKHWVAKKKK